MLTVTVSGNGGSVKVNHVDILSYPYEYTFQNGTEVHIEAVPCAGYRFINWYGDLSGSANPTTVLVDCDKVIIANFSATGPSLNSSLTIPIIGSIVLLVVLLVLLAVALIAKHKT